jgi:hypothetical protein
VARDVSAAMMPVFFAENQKQKTEEPLAKFIAIVDGYQATAR